MQAVTCPLFVCFYHLEGLSWTITNSLTDPTQNKIILLCIHFLTKKALDVKTNCYFKQVEQILSRLFIMFYVPDPKSIRLVLVIYHAVLNPNNILSLEEFVTTELQYM